MHELAVLFAGIAFGSHKSSVNKSLERRLARARRLLGKRAGRLAKREHFLPLRGGHQIALWGQFARCLCHGFRVSLGIYEISRCRSMLRDLEDLERAQEHQ